MNVETSRSTILLAKDSVTSCSLCLLFDLQCSIFTELETSSELETIETRHHCAPSPGGSPNDFNGFLYENN